MDLYLTFFLKSLLIISIMQVFWFILSYFLYILKDPKLHCFSHRFPKGPVILVKTIFSSLNCLLPLLKIKTKKTPHNQLNRNAWLLGLNFTSVVTIMNFILFFNSKTEPTHTLFFFNSFDSSWSYFHMNFRVRWLIFTKKKENSNGDWVEITYWLEDS